MPGMDGQGGTVEYGALVERLKKSDLTQVRNVRALFDMARNMRDVELCKFARSKADKIARDGNAEALELVRETYLWAAPFDFDSYMIYLEWNRKPQERFYLPRRKQLLRAVHAIQDLIDGKLDELFLSQPPRTGKTTLLLFLCTWIIGRDSELSNLYSAYSDVITSAFYQGVLEIITDKETYLWSEIFPRCTIAGTNAKNETINIDRNKRYASLTCRSLYGTLNGACDCKGLLISDDLIGGIEEALNKDRLISAWSKVENNLIPRAVGERKKFLWCGTRWSMADPIGLRVDLIENDKQFANWRYRILNMPALDENDESNFHYSYGVGFTTDEYHRRRASFERNNDMASWLAQYMQEPIERDGAVFSPNDFRYFNGVLPDGVPDRVFMAVDPAWGGGDFVAGPVCFKYGHDIYIPDVVYSNADKSITQPLIAETVKQHGIAALQIEADKSRIAYAEGVENCLRNMGLKINITTRTAPHTGNGKQQRIFDKAPDIRERMIFVADGHRSKEYQLFMQNVFSFKVVGKNKNDDAPDSLCMAITMDAFVSNKTRVSAPRW